MTRRRDVPYWLHPLYEEARRKRRAREQRRRLAIAYALVLALWVAAFLIVRH